MKTSCRGSPTGFYTSRVLGIERFPPDVALIHECEAHNTPDAGDVFYHLWLAAPSDTSSFEHMAAL